MNIMKTLWLSVTLSLFGIAAYAQNTQIGVKGGVNLSNFYVDEVQDNNMKVGLNLGLFAKLPVTSGFAIQPEPLYSSKGSKIAYNNIFGDGEYRFNFNYIEMPVLAVINLTENFNIHAGPYAGYLASTNIKHLSNGEIDDVADLEPENFRRIDFGLAGGIGVELNGFHFGARYTHGLSNVGKDDNISGQVLKNAHNSAISLYIGIGF